MQSGAVVALPARGRRGYRSHTIGIVVAGKAGAKGRGSVWAAEPADAAVVALAAVTNTAVLTKCAARARGLSWDSRAVMSRVMSWLCLSFVVSIEQADAL